MARTSYINSCTGLSLTSAEIIPLLERMTLSASQSSADPDEIVVEVPPTRPDIFHECDIVEDTAIAYGFNKLPDTFPATNTVAQPLEMSKLTDVVRTTWAQAGFVEVLPLILVRSAVILHFCLLIVSPQCSHEENFAWLNKVDDGKTAIKIGNPKTLEFQVVRTSLIPGLLKTIRENRSHPLPIKVFESTDVVFKDPSLERQARNVRHAAAIWCNKSAGFEVIHGLLDKIMKTLEVKRISASDTKSESGYYLKEKDGKHGSLL